MKKIGVLVTAMLVLGPFVAAEASFGRQKDQKRGSAGEGQRSGGMIERFDEDGDGKISMDEFPGPDEHFQDFDDNGDGLLEPAEMPARGSGGRGERGRGGRDGEMMERFDDDGDGRISMEEFPGPDDRFEEMDTNGDGFISRDDRPQRGSSSRRSSSSNEKDGG